MWRMIVSNSIIAADSHIPCVNLEIEPSSKFIGWEDSDAIVNLFSI